MSSALNRYLLIATVAIAATSAGIYFGKSGNTTLNPTDQSGAVDLARLQLASAAGAPVNLEQWAGKIRVINFWATWCPPCREEMPAFSRIHSKMSAKGVQFIGIGIDTPDNILAFQKENPVSYPLLLGSYEHLKATATLGNASMSLPFTVIMDTQGRIVLTKQGKLDEAELEQRLATLMAGAPKQ